MEQSYRQLPQVLLDSRSALPSLRLVLAVLLLSAGIAVLLEWGEGSQSPYPANPNLARVRYGFHSGWIHLWTGRTAPFRTKFRPMY